MIKDKPYEIVEIKKLTPSVTSFIFKAKDGTSIDFTPGMFAMLAYKNESTGESIARAFSIANSPPSDRLEFVISLIHGRFTSKLDDAKIGDRYLVSAPYGQFKFDINAGKKFLFLAGGTGIAPFMSMLRYAKQLNSDMDSVMLYSTKYANELIYKEQLEAYAKESEFRLIITVTRPQEGDGWKGETGHVNTEMMKREVPDFMERISYICGPPAFVKACKDALISMGVKSENVKAEMWG